MWNPHNQLTGPNLTASLVTGIKCVLWVVLYIWCLKLRHTFKRHSDINDLSILSRVRQAVVLFFSTVTLWRKTMVCVWFFWVLLVIFPTGSRLSRCVLMTIWMFKENLSSEIRIQLFYDLEVSSWTSLSLYIDKCASDTCTFTCVYGGCAQAKLSCCLCPSADRKVFCPLFMTGCVTGWPLS